MLSRYTRLLLRHRRLALSLVGILFVACVAANLDLANRLDYNYFVDDATEAEQGKQLLENQFGEGAPNMILIVTPKSGDLAQAAPISEDLARRLRAEPRLANVSAYLDPGADPHMVSKAGDRGLITARILGDGNDRDEVIRQLAPEYRRLDGPVEVRIGGPAEFLREEADQSRHDIEGAELKTAPLILIALLFVFGSVVASTIPLGVATIAIVGTGGLLWVQSQVSPVSTIAQFLTSLLAFGLGIDYSLFLINRFREELDRDGDSEAAVERTVATAGRTILFSGTAVAAGLSGMLLLSLSFMRSVGIGLIFTAGICCLTTLTVVPIWLANLGPNVNKWSLKKTALKPGDGTQGFWYRIAHLVMRRPLLVTLLVVPVFVVVSLPALHMNPGLIDDRDLQPGTNGARAAGDILREDFSGQVGDPVPIAAPDAGPHPERALSAYARRLVALDGVVKVETATGSFTPTGREPIPPERAAGYIRGGAAWLNLVSDLEPLSSAQDRQLDQIRATPSALGRTLVTGEAANTKDVTDRLVGSFPRALVFIAVVSMIVLFLQFGSVLLPLMAVALTTLSLGAMFGLWVLVFQDGHLSAQLDFTPVHFLYINIPVAVFCTAFGLAMDYQLFVLSRIKEEYDQGTGFTEAIALGMGRSGPIITAAAVMIAVVFFGAGFFSGAMLTKSLGFALGTVVLLDAFIIRGTLVPALMRLAGYWSWWAPRPLRRLYWRFGLAESPTD